MKTCIYFTSDLMFSSRVKPVAAAQGFEVQFPGFEGFSFQSQPELVIFDLEFLSRDELMSAINLIRNNAPESKTVAYAPHVKTDLLDSAREMGVDLVWSRGQFNKQFPTLF